MKFAYADPDELMLGTAGEHLVCADLLLCGIRAFLTTQDCPYDVAAEFGRRLLRIQVKTTRKPRQYAQKRQQHIIGYIWTLRRGKGAMRAYGADEFDAVALVALDTRQIAYLLPTDIRQTFCIPVGGHKTACKTFDRFPLNRVMETGP